MKINWAKASDEAKVNYSLTLNEDLSNVQVPDCISCLNLQCKLHNDAIEEYTLAVLEGVDKAAQKTLPCTGGGKCSSKSSKPTPGWSEFVSPFAEDNKFWNAVWVSAGKPREGHLFEIMKKN